MLADGFGDAEVLARRDADDLAPGEAEAVGYGQRDVDYEL